MSRWNNIGSNRKRRQIVGDRDGWFCWICGHPLDIDNSTLDHVESPSGKGNKLKYSLNNMKIACYTCNYVRGGGKINKDTLAKHYQHVTEQLRKRNEDRSANQP